MTVTAIIETHALSGDHEKKKKKILVCEISKVSHANDTLLFIVVGYNGYDTDICSNSSDSCWRKKIRI